VTSRLNLYSSHPEVTDRQISTQTSTAPQHKKKKRKEKKKEKKEPKGGVNYSKPE